MLITSHNMAEIERLCRRVVFMAGGRIVADGTSQDIASRYGAEDLESTFLSIAAEHRIRPAPGEAASGVPTEIGR